MSVSQPPLLDDRVDRGPARPEQARWRHPDARPRRGEFVRRLHLVRLRFHLVLLTLIGFVPTAGLLLYTTKEQHGQDASGAQQEALRLARLVAGEHEGAIDAARQLVAMLAQLPDVRQQQPDRCNALVADLRRRYPRYANLGGLTLNGSVFCSAVPVTGAPDLSGGALFWRALEKTDFQSDDYQIDRATGRATVNVSHPLLDEAGTVQGAVFAAIDLTWLKKLPAVARLPEGSSLTISDRHCRIRVRYPDPAKWVGRFACERPFADGVLVEGEGSAETDGPDGIPRFVGYAPLRSGDGRETVDVTVGIPQHAALAATDSVFARNLAVLGLIAALALVAARIVGSRFVPAHARALAHATTPPTAGGRDARAARSPEPSHLGSPLETPGEAVETRRPYWPRRRWPRADAEPHAERRRYRRGSISPVRQRLRDGSAAVARVVRACFGGVHAAIAGAVRAGLQRLRDGSRDLRWWSRRRRPMPDPDAGGEPSGSGACTCSACRARLRGRRA